MNYQDLYDLTEDMRIDHIGRHVMATGQSVMLTTDDVPGKLDRYIDKLTGRFPLLEVAGRGAGPVSGAVYCTVRKRGH